MTRLIGITGLARSGKDTIASVLVNRGWTRLAFADALKAEVVEFCGITLDELERDKAALRRVLQLRGTEYWRRRDPEHWIRILRRRITEDDWEPGVIPPRHVVTDVRFPNEADWIRRSGGIVVLSVRHDPPPACHDHASERGVSEIVPDAVIDASSVQERVIKTEQLIRERGLA